MPADTLRPVQHQSWRLVHLERSDRWTWCGRRIASWLRQVPTGDPGCLVCLKAQSAAADRESRR